MERAVPASKGVLGAAHACALDDGSAEQRVHAAPPRPRAKRRAAAPPRATLEARGRPLTARRAPRSARPLKQGRPVKKKTTVHAAAMPIQRKPRRQGTRVKKMPVWEEYGELLDHVSAMAKERKAAGAQPDERFVRLRECLQDLVDHTEPPRARRARPRALQIDSKLCALPDAVLVRALCFSTNRGVGAVAATAFRTKQLVDEHKLMLYHSSAQGAAAISTASGLELARLEAWTDVQEHDEEPEIPRLPEDEMAVDGLLAFVKIVQTPRSIKDGEWPREPSHLPSLEPVVLACQWLELDESMVSRGGLNIKLQNPIEFPTSALLTLDVTLYNPRTSKAASLFHGDTELDDHELYDSGFGVPDYLFERFFAGFRHSETFFDGGQYRGLYLEKIPECRATLIPVGDDEDEEDDDEDEFPALFASEFISIGFEWRVHSRNMNAHHPDIDARLNGPEVGQGLYNLRWNTVVIDKDRPAIITALDRIESALGDLFSSNTPSEIKRLSRKAIHKQIALSAGADISEFHQFIASFIPRCLALHPGKEPSIDDFPLPGDETAIAGETAMQRYDRQGNELRARYEKYERQRNRWQSRADKAIRTASQHAASEAPRAMMGAASSLAS